jgi:hypothetical protein
MVMKRGLPDENNTWVLVGTNHQGGPHPPCCTSDSPEKAAELASKFGTSPEHFETLITGGDYRYAFELASEVSGSDDEAAAYLEWLERRTLNLMRHPIFWPGVSAVAGGLCEAERLCRGGGQHC